jgi:UDP-glucuronate decarboxylase
MIKVLITGGAGHIGSSLAMDLIQTGRYHVTILDNLSTGSAENLPDALPGTWRFAEGDVNVYNQLAPVMEEGRFDYVFHYAAMVGVQRTTQNPLAVMEDLEGLKYITRLCAATGVKRIFFSSSSEVYGEPVHIPQHEDHTPLNARLPYALVKSIGEAWLRSYFQEQSLPYTILRFFNTYGPRQTSDFVLSRFIRAALDHDPIFINGDGMQTRTFLHVDDNTYFTRYILENNLFVNDTVNVGSEKEITIAALAKIVKQVTASESAIVYRPALKQGDMMRRCPDNTKMLQCFNRPLISLEAGIKKLLQEWQPGYRFQKEQAL